MFQLFLKLENEISIGWSICDGLFTFLCPNCVCETDVDLLPVDIVTGCDYEFASALYNYFNYKPDYNFGSENLVQQILNRESTYWYLKIEEEVRC